MGGLENPYQEIERLTNEVNRLQAENAILVADLKKYKAPLSRKAQVLSFISGFVASVSVMSVSLWLAR